MERKDTKEVLDESIQLQQPKPKDGFDLSSVTGNATSIIGIEDKPIIPFPPQFRSLAIRFAHEKNFKARRKLLEMYANHLMSFKHSILINRRRWQQRLHRRQVLMRSFFMQHILDLETSYLELIPIPKLSIIQVKKNIPQEFKSSKECTMPTYMHQFFEDVMKLVCENDWLSSFRVRKSTFEWLCEQLKESVQPAGQHFPFRELDSREKLISLGLHAFANGVDYAEIARVFEITFRTTICKFLKWFAEAILKKWGKQFLTMPTTEEEYDGIGNEFYSASNMPPAAVGVLGVCELTTKSFKPVNISSNELGNSTIIMQMLIDNKLLFRKVKFDTNQPTLFLEEINEITNLPPKMINEQPVSRFIVTPETYYPLRKWLMHKYQEPIEPHEFDFNEAVDNLFVFRDHALQRLFARWHILKYNGDLDPRTMEKIALACCVLHNVVEVLEEPFVNEWTKWLNIENTKFTMSTRFKPVLNVFQGRAYSWEADGAPEVREFLGRTISSTEM